MAVHMQDEEEINNFKYHWRRWGRWVCMILVLGALGYLGSVLYKGHQESNTEAAAGLFETYITESQSKDDVAAKKTLLQLQQSYPKTMPAAQATLLMASLAFDQGQYDDTVGHLEWVKRQQTNDFIQTIVAQRLAAVFLQQGKYDLALQALDIKVAETFQAVLLETKGDVLVAENKTTEAVAAYDAALKALPEDDQARRETIQIKKDVIAL